MELHQLRDFVAVASTGGFSLAAKKCRVAQSSLSKAILRLEVEIGEKLFVRAKRRCVLTPAGEVLYRRANRDMNEIEQPKRDLSDANGLRYGTVKIGVLPTISPYFIPRVLAQFAQKFPSLCVDMLEDRTSDLLSRIDVGELDFAIVSLPLSRNGLEKETLFKEELLLTVPSNHPLAVKDKVEMKDLETDRFILMREGHCLADQVLSFCHKSNLHLKIDLEASQIETLQSLVMAGLGITLVPQIARINGKVPLVYRSLENPKPTRTVTVVWRSGRQQTRAAAEFLAQLRQTTKAFVETLKL